MARAYCRRYRGLCVWRLLPAVAGGPGGIVRFRFSWISVVSARFGFVCLCALFFTSFAQGGVLSLSIPEIQGRAAQSPYAGQEIATEGVVSLLTSAGFFLQDPSGDGDPATSDGIYVFLDRRPEVKSGDRLRLRARVAEYAVGKSAQALANPLTELVQPQIEVLGSAPLPEALEIRLPLADQNALERAEGMLVRIAGPLTVQQNHFLGRYGLLTLAAGGRQEVPGNRHPPGSAEARALALENARRRILLDDASSRQNPERVPFLGLDDTVRAGDTLDALLGVVDYGLSSHDPAGPAGYRIQPLEKPRFQRSNPRPSRPPEVGGELRVASFNLLNYFITLDQPGARCLPASRRAGSARAARGECRGARSAAEFERQQAKLVAALTALDADLLGLIEVENQGDAAVQSLAAALNARLGPGTYASVGLPVEGTGEDAIRVAMLYKPARLRPEGPARSDTAAIHSRPPLAQTFATSGGERFSVIVAHLKSKSRCPEDARSADADQGDGQGCWNARRVAQARALQAFSQRIQAQSGDKDVLLIGDLNAYAREAPLELLRAAGWVDQLGRFQRFAYSYVFDGEAGTLDHALATPGLSARITGAAHWRINADEPALLDYRLDFRQPACPRCAPDLYRPDPYRSSDHDPVLLGLRPGR